MSHGIGIGWPTWVLGSRFCPISVARGREEQARTRQSWTVSAKLEPSFQKGWVNGPSHESHIIRSSPRPKRLTAGCWKGAKQEEGAHRVRSQLGPLAAAGRKTKGLHEESLVWRREEAKKTGEDARPDREQEWAALTRLVPRLTKWS